MDWKTRLRIMLADGTSTKFQLGSKVYIVDCGMCFINHEKMAKTLNLTNWDQDKIIPAYIKGVFVRYTIISKPHIRGLHTIYGVEHPNGLQYIMSDKGLQGAGLV